MATCVTGLWFPGVRTLPIITSQQTFIHILHNQNKKILPLVDLVGDLWIWLVVAFSVSALIPQILLTSGGG